MTHFLFQFSQGLIIFCSLVLLFISVSKIITLRYIKNIRKSEHNSFKKDIKKMYKFINSLNEQDVENDISTILSPSSSNKNEVYNDQSIQSPLIATSFDTTITGAQGCSYSSSITAYSFNHKTKEMLGITDGLESSSSDSSEQISDKITKVTCKNIQPADNSDYNCVDEQKFIEEYESLSSSGDDLIYRVYEYRQLVRTAEKKLRVLLKRKNYYYQMILYSVLVISIYSLFIGLFYKCGHISISLFQICSRLVYIVMTDIQQFIILMMNTMFIYVSILTLSNITKPTKVWIRVFFTIFITASLVATPISYLITEISCKKIDIRRNIIQASVILSISVINLLSFSLSIKLALGKVGYILFYSVHILLETIGIKKKKSVSRRSKTDLEEKYQAKRRLKNNLSILLIVNILLIGLGVYHLIKGILEFGNPSLNTGSLDCCTMIFKFRYIIQDTLKFVILFWYLGLVNSYITTEYRNLKNLHVVMNKISKIIQKENIKD